MTTGVLLTNLGSPHELSVAAIRRFLREFLSDPHVIDLPKWLWKSILEGVILPRRPKKLLHAYQSIWAEQGSPLIHITQRQLQKLTTYFQDDIFFVCGMRYGTPALSDALNTLQKQKCSRLIVLPLYPQYAKATTGSTFEFISQKILQWPVIPKLHFINQYAHHTLYLEAVAEKMHQHFQKNATGEYVIFSYHGLPTKASYYAEDYAASCQLTSEKIAKILRLNSNQYQTTFQSRFGLSAWLQPYTDLTLQTLPKKGIKNVSIVCPGFSADCLETLEEIKIRGQDSFLKAGGQQFDYVPALNEDDNHIEALASLVKEQLK